MTPSYAIRPAVPEELPQLPGIERAASELFRPFDLSESVFADETTLEDFEEAQQAGQLWVACTDENQPVGFAFVELVDGQPHLDELDVHPTHGRRGIGRALVVAVAEWARAQGYRSITLTTFREIPWNAPFYESLGFRSLAPSEWTAELRELVEEEATRGLDPAKRAVMRWDLAVGG